MRRTETALLPVAAVASIGARCNTKAYTFMTNVHMIVGSIVVVLYLINFVMYTLTFLKGKAISYHRLVAMGAAAFLLLQYMLGFSLLGSGGSIAPLHIVLALSSILPVGAEHMLTAQETSFRRRGIIGMMATLITFVLVLIAFMIGERNS
jgi:hypothetical protein